MKIRPVDLIKLNSEISRDEKRLKRSHCIQWERNAISCSVSIVYSGNALTVSRPWKFHKRFNDF
jgi:hypothetical protein